MRMVKSLSKLVLFVISFLVMVSCHAITPVKLEKIQGLYKYKFANGLVDGTKYQSENRLTILPISRTSAYFNTHLECANGHMCDFSGIGKLNKDNALIFKTPSILNKTCVFKIHIESDGVKFEDEGGACRLIACGARGRLENVKFKYISRHNVSPDLIKKSVDFRNMMKQYQQSSH